jgi:hypothetical protein
MWQTISVFNTRTKSVSLPMFYLNDALTPIDVRRILALLQIGLEECGKEWPEPTEQDFFDALKTIPLDEAVLAGGRAVSISV